MSGFLSKNKKKSIQALGNKEVKDFKSNLFRMNEFGGVNEANALIKRYEKKIPLSEKDKRILRENAPAAPDFELMNQAQYEQKGCWKKRKYRNKVESYFEGRKKYYEKDAKKEKGKAQKLSRGQRFALKKQELEAKFANPEGYITEEQAQQNEDLIQEPKLKEELIQENKLKEKQIPEQNSSDEINDLITKYENEGIYTDLDADMDAMDNAFKDREADEEHKKAEDTLAQKEAEKLKKDSLSCYSGIKSYCNLSYSIMNRMLRQTKGRATSYNHIIKPMKKLRLNRDLIARRGVANLQTAAHMLGVDPTGIDEEQLKSLLKERFNSGKEMIMTDHGFISTALPGAEKNFDASSGSGGIGIEFMILAKKGTSAINVTSISSHSDERELLICPGTKFRVVGMKLDGDANILYGNEKSWKIYLESIPASEEGKINQAA